MKELNKNYTLTLGIETTSFCIRDQHWVLMIAKTWLSLSVFPLFVLLLLSFTSLISNIPPENHAIDPQQYSLFVKNIFSLVSIHRISGIYLVEVCWGCNRLISTAGCISAAQGLFFSTKSTYNCTWTMRDCIIFTSRIVLYIYINKFHVKFDGIPRVWNVSMEQF